MKTTLLQIVQSILSDMDAEDVNSISDTVEAQQIGSVVEDTFYNIIAGRDIPEHSKLVQLTSLSDATRPTHFSYPANLKSLESVSYNVSTTSTPDWKEIKYKSPQDFLRSMDQTGLEVTTLSGGVSLYVVNDSMPTYYTTFDDEYIILDAYDVSVEANLMASKTRALSTEFPTFTQSDAFEPDLDETMMVYLIAEAKSTCFSLFKSGTDPKIEQSARRLKSHIRNDLHKTASVNKKRGPRYGR